MERGAWEHPNELWPDLILGPVSSAALPPKLSCAGIPSTCTLFLQQLLWVPCPVSSQIPALGLGKTKVLFIGIFLLLEPWQRLKLLLPERQWGSLRDPPTPQEPCFQCSFNYRWKQKCWCEVGPPSQADRSSCLGLLISSPAFTSWLLSYWCLFQRHGAAKALKCFILSFVWCFGAFSESRGATYKCVWSQIPVLLHGSPGNTFAKETSEAAAFPGAASVARHDKLPLLLASFLSVLSLCLLAHLISAVWGEGPSLYKVLVPLSTRGIHCTWSCKQKVK